MDSILIGASEYSATADEVKHQIQQHQAAMDASAAEKRKQDYAMEFDKNAPEFVVPSNAKAEQVDYLQKRFNEQREAQRFSYAQSKEADFQKEFDRTRKEKEKEIVQRIAWLEENAKGNPALQKELNNFRNYGQSEYSADNAASQIAMLGSRNPQAVERGMKAQPKVNSDLVKYGNATAADMETINVMRAATVMIPKYSAEDMIKRKNGQFAVGSRNEKSLSNEELAAQNLRNSGSLTIGKADPKLLDEPSKLVDGKETNKNLGRDNLASEMDAFDKIYKTSLLDPEAAARAHADADMKAADIDPNGYSGMIIDKDGVGALQAKSVAENLGRNYKALANDKSMSFAERNKEIVRRSLEDGNVTPQNTSPAEYLAITQDTYKRVQLLRDAGAQAAITSSTLRNAEMQANAYEGIVSQMNELVTSSAINPDMMLAAFEKSYKTGDAMSIAALVNGSDKMKMIDSINKEEFRRGWDNTKEGDKFTFFADRVLDVMMDYTRNLKDDNQLHSMAVVRRLREANLSGKLGGEPIVAHMLNTMYQQFLKTGAVKLDEQSKVAQQRLESGVLDISEGDQKYEVLFNPSDPNSVAAAESIAVSAKQMPGIMKTMTDIGIADKNGQVIATGDDAMISAKVARNLSGGILSNDVYRSMVEAGTVDQIDNLTTILNNYSAGDNNLRDFSPDEASRMQGMTSARKELALAFGADPDSATARIGKAIAENPRLAEMWRSTSKGQGPVRTAIALAALEIAEAAPAYEAQSRADLFIRDAGLTVKEGDARVYMNLETAPTQLDAAYERHLRNAGDGYTADVASGDLHEIRGIMSKHDAYKKEVDKQAKDQMKVFGYVDEKLANIQTKMNETGAVLLKYENEIKSIVDAGTRAMGQDISAIESARELQATHPWVKHNGMKIHVYHPPQDTPVGSQRGGLTAFSSRPASKPRSIYYIVPSDFRGSMPEGNQGIKVGSDKTAAKRRLNELNETLFVPQ